MSTTWIRDKVVAVAEAQAGETGEDPNEIIWQLSKELGHMAQISGSTPPSEETLMDRIRATCKTGAPIVSDEKFEAALEKVTEEYPDLPTSDQDWGAYGLPLIPDVNPDSIPTFDVISRPAHYEEGRKYEPKKVIRDWGLNFNVGSAVKYCSRHGKKGDAIQDLEKAREFIGFEIDALKAERDEQEEA